jgi:hypothetical protein
MAPMEEFYVPPPDPSYLICPREQQIATDDKAVPS